VCRRNRRYSLVRKKSCAGPEQRAKTSGETNHGRKNAVLNGGETLRIPDLNEVWRDESGSDFGGKLVPRGWGIVGPVSPLRNLENSGKGDGHSVPPEGKPGSNATKFQCKSE